MKTLIFHPHGLGDCILATPAIKKYKETTGDFLGFATQYRFKNAGLFNYNPHIDELVYTKDAWLDYEGNFALGCKDILRYLNFYTEHNKYDKIIPIYHGQVCKIDDVAKALDVFPLSEKEHHTEIYSTAGDAMQAETIIKQLFGDNEFGFIQTKTGLDKRNLPEGFGEQWIKNNTDIENIFEVGKSIDSSKYRINVEYEIMRRASCIVLPNSCFYHAACAMDLKIDFVYFADGRGGFKKVQHKHKVNQNEVFSL